MKIRLVGFEENQRKKIIVSNVNIDVVFDENEENIEVDLFLCYVSKASQIQEYLKIYQNKKISLVLKKEVMAESQILIHQVFKSGGFCVFTEPMRLEDYGALLEEWLLPSKWFLPISFKQEMGCLICEEDAFQLAFFSKVAPKNIHEIQINLNPLAPFSVALEVEKMHAPLSSPIFLSKVKILEPSLYVIQNMLRTSGLYLTSYKSMDKEIINNIEKTVRPLFTICKKNFESELSIPDVSDISNILVFTDFWLQFIVQFFHSSQFKDVESVSWKPIWDDLRGLSNQFFLTQKNTIQMTYLEESLVLQSALIDIISPFMKRKIQNHGFELEFSLSESRENLILLKSPLRTGE